VASVFELSQRDGARAIDDLPPVDSAVDVLEAIASR
jgi:hypothetical protein